jgi:hypothetical protein
VLLAFGASAPARAQARGPAALRPELRVDLIAGRAAATHVAVAVARPAGTYARIVGAVGQGVAWKNGQVRYAARVDALGRFYLDPFANRSAAWYGTGGLSLLYDGFDEWRPLLTVGIGVESRPRGPLTYAAELGLGGGARVGLALRWRRGTMR